MPEPGCSARWSASQASRCSAVVQADDAQPERLAVERAAQHDRVGAELLGDVVGHPLVGGRGRGEHRDAVGELGEQGADPTVVGPEVVAPVGDAVRLVDDEQPAAGREPGQHLVAEAGVVEPLGADQQHVDLAGVDRVVDRLPLLDVRGVDGDRADPGALGGGDLVAHQGQQWRDDHGRPGALLAEEEGRDEVDGRLAPARALHHQRATPVDGQRLDRGPLVVVERRVGLPVARADQRAQVLLGLEPDVGAGLGHPACLPAPTPTPESRGARVAVRRPGPGDVRRRRPSSPRAAGRASRPRAGRPAGRTRRGRRRASGRRRTRPGCRGPGAAAGGAGS